MLRPGDVILLDGPLGAGKTTFVRGLLEALGHVGEVPSPSFAIVQPYDDLALPLWHVDLYRIAHPSELAELGLDTHARRRRAGGRMAGACRGGRVAAERARFVARASTTTARAP